MAKQVITTLIDDLDGSEASETVTVGLDGIAYEVDLSHGHARELRAALAPFVAAGRRAGKLSASGHVATVVRKRSGGGDTTATRARNREIRAWAKEHGYEVSDRGRIPAEVVAAWRAGTPAPVVPAPVVTGAGYIAGTGYTDQYSAMNRSELVKLARERGAPVAVTGGKVGVLREWLRDNPESTPTEAPPAPDLSKYTPTQRAEYYTQVRAFARLHKREVSDRGRPPADVIAAYEANDPALLSA